MPKNFIILDGGAGVPVNLDYVTTVQYGGDFASATADQLKSVFVYQAVPTTATPGGKTRPTYQAVMLPSANLAVAMFNRILATMATLGYVGDDLRKSLARVDSLDNALPVGGVDTLITVTGDNFNGNGKITINGMDIPTAGFNFIDAQHISFQTGTGFAMGGPYDVEYTQPDGVAAVLAGGISFS